ncbi:MAG: phospholipase [Pseudomonadales bacterium]|nr:phospholipase [Pseudomonadales bacterium]
MHLELFRLISLLASRLPEAAVEYLAAGLSACPDAQAAQQTSVRLMQGLDGHNRVHVSELLHAWAQNAPELSGNELAAALGAAAYQDRVVRSAVNLELVWTGPHVANMGLRNTEQVLKELIGSARSTILLVTFAAFHIPSLVEALNEAIRRGVRVTFVLEDKKESGGKVFANASEALSVIHSPLVKVFVWPYECREKNEHGMPGALHAKFMVVDESKLFISSANLTDYALNLNIELGVLISGGDAPVQAWNNVQALIRKGALQNLLELGERP